MEVESLTMDAEEQSLRDAGREADMNEGRPSDESSATPAEPRAPAQEVEPKAESQPSDVDVPEQKPESSEIKSEEPQQQQRAKDGKFQKAESEYRKAQKEEERKTRTWQSIQAEKEQIRREQAQWQETRLMEQLEAQRQAFGPLKHDGLTAKQYWEGAEVFAEQGDHDKAYQALKIANQLWQAELGRVDEMRTIEQEYQWRVQMDQAKQAQPDLFNPGSPQGGYLNMIMQNHANWLYNEPNGQGFQRAREVAELLVKADLLSELQDEVVELRAYKEAHQHKSQPTKGGYAAPRLGEKDFDDMSLDEQEAHLRGLTAEADHFR